MPGDSEDPVAAIQRQTSGVHGALVTAVHPAAFGQAILEVVLKGLTIRGSIAGTRQDMAEAIDFYARGLIHPTVTTRELGEVNEVLDEMRAGKIDGRVVITY